MKKAILLAIVFTSFLSGLLYERYIYGPAHPHSTELKDPRGQELSTGGGGGGDGYIPVYVKGGAQGSVGVEIGPEHGVDRGSPSGGKVGVNYDHLPWGAWLLIWGTLTTLTFLVVISL